jgi:aminopeptidase-like protein
LPIPVSSNWIRTRTSEVFSPARGVAKSSATGGIAPGEFVRAMLWVLSFSDRAHDLLDIARRASLDFSLIARAASALESAGLVRTTEPKAAGWSNLT